MNIEWVAIKTIVFDFKLADRSDVGGTARQIVGNQMAKVIWIFGVDKISIGRITFEKVDTLTSIFSNNGDVGTFMFN